MDHLMTNVVIRVIIYNIKISNTLFSNIHVWCFSVLIENTLVIIQEYYYYLKIEFAQKHNNLDVFASETKTQKQFFIILKIL